MPTRSDRPTVPPAFDVAQYAKDSDARVATVPVARAEPPESAESPESGPISAADSKVARSEMRLLTRPQLAAVITDEAWARTMTGAPKVVMSPSELKRLPLDHRAGFVLSLLDGSLDLVMLVEIAAMPREEVLRVVRDLYESGVVDFR